MEFIDVVDGLGNYTGEVIERSKVQDLKLSHFEVIVFVLNDKKQVLLQKRSSNKKYFPNKWALLSGLVISGEKIDDAAIRELNEELGIKVAKDKLYILDNSSLTKFYYTICNKNEDEFMIQKSELSEVKWFDIDEVIDMINNIDDSIVIKKERLSLFYKIKKIYLKIDEI